MKIVSVEQEIDDEGPYSDVYFSDSDDVVVVRWDINFACRTLTKIFADATRLPITGDDSGIPKEQLERIVDDVYGRTLDWYAESSEQAAYDREIDLRVDEQKEGRS